MRIRPVLTLAIPLACAALFVRLGFWQLARLEQRRGFNRTLTVRVEAPPVDVSMLPADTAQGHYRRVSASGAFLYDHQVVYAGRSFDGSPGVNLLSPITRPCTDTVVMVNRGWAYSPNASTFSIRLAGASCDSVRVEGFAETYAGTNRPSPGAAPNVVHALDRAAVARIVGRPIAPYVLVQTSDTVARGDTSLSRLSLPVLDEGPHKSYAIQWFSFAVIAVAGGVALARRPS